jgi:hypothetical protein
MDICDPYPPRTHLGAERLKQARRRYVSRPRVASGSCLGSDEERQGCSVHRRQTVRGDTELSEGRQTIGYRDEDSVTDLQRAYT